ncbi:hypothetical protein CUMW_245350, partial [Citrus unshiu]
EGQRLQQVKDQLSQEAEDQQYWEEAAWILVPFQKHVPQLPPPAPHLKEPPPDSAHLAPHLPGRPQPSSCSPKDLISPSRAALRVLTLILRWKRRRSVPRLQADLRILVGGFLPTTLTRWRRGQSRNKRLGRTDAGFLRRRRRVAGATRAPTTLPAHRAEDLVIHPGSYVH